MSDLIDRQTLINMLTRTPGVGNRILDVVRTAPSVNSVSTPCQQDVNGDVIDRQAAIDVINRTDVEGASLNDVIVITEACAKAVSRLPSARKTGKWIHSEVSNGEYTALIPESRCSECGLYVYQESNYCPTAEQI